MEAQIRGLTDVRTGEYVKATEANRGEVIEALGFMFAWRFYWDGPLSEDQRPIYGREEWFASDERGGWIGALSEKQQQMLEDSFPPEEVPIFQE